MYVYNIRNTEKCYEQHKIDISQATEKSISQF